MLNIATFNIFWFPKSDIAQNARAAEDEDLIVRVIGSLAADVIAFQEILDLESLEALLGRVPGRDYRLRNAGGAWLASAGGSMNVACAYDAGTLDLVDATRLSDPSPKGKFGGRRHPYVLHVRHRSSGRELTVVGVHLKSGDPWSKDEYSAKRLLETKHIAKWLAGESKALKGHFQRPPTQDVVVIGDFNAVWDHVSLEPLRSEKLEDWRRPSPGLTASLATGSPASFEDGDRIWSTYRDKAVIDHAFVAPSTAGRLVDAGWLYAFDGDSALDKSPPGPKHWLRQADDYRCIPWQGAHHAPVPNLYRASDHRPLRISLSTN